MNEQLFTEGDQITHNGTKLECTFVSWQDIRDENGTPTGEKENFTYSFRPLKDMNRERKETTIPTGNESKGE